MQNRREFMSSTLALAASAQAERKTAGVVPPVSVREHLIWRDSPAVTRCEVENYDTAFPLGNGRLGALLYGGVGRNRLALNHNRLWRETHRDWTVPDTAKNLAYVRKLFFDGKVREGGEAAFELLGCE